MRLTSIHHLTDGQRTALFAALGFVVGAAIDMAGLVIAYPLESPDVGIVEALRADPVQMVGTLITALLAAVVGLHIAKRWNRELRLEERIRNNWRNLASILERSPFAKIVTGPDGTVLFRNSTTERFFQDSEGLTPGRPLTLFDPVQGETRIRLAGDGFGFFQIYTTPMRWDGEPAVLVSLLDVTQQKELERLKEDVDRIMHHDLKGPLNGIIGVPQAMVLDGNLTPEQVELMTALEVSGRKMLHMIDLSLDLFKMETGAYECAPERVDALATLRHLAHETRTKLEAKELRLETRLDGTPVSETDRLHVLAEERLLHSMLSNLLLNAVEASPPGETVLLDITTHDGPCIRIRNRGSVPEAMRDQFFEKYRTHGKRSGTGLGTYSAKLMADAMGHELHMETSDDEDSTCVMVRARPDTIN